LLRSIYFNWLCAVERNKEKKLTSLGINGVPWKYRLYFAYISIPVGIIGFLLWIFYHKKAYRGRSFKEALREGYKDSMPSTSYYINKKYIKEILIAGLCAIVGGMFYCLKEGLMKPAIIIPGLFFPGLLFFLVYFFEERTRKQVLKTHSIKIPKKEMIILTIVYIVVIGLFIYLTTDFWTKPLDSFHYFIIFISLLVLSPVILYTWAGR